MKPRRLITWLGSEHDISSDADIQLVTGIPKQHAVTLDHKDSGGRLTFVFDMRSLTPGSTAPPLPHLPPLPQPDEPPPANSSTSVLRARADVLRRRGLDHLQGVRRSVREQHASLRALDAALQSLRCASAHGAPTEALSDEWRGVVQAVAGERAASEGLPLQSSPEGSMCSSSRG